MTDSKPLVPGEVIGSSDPVTINAGKPVTRILVSNTADRPVQVGSHYHFAEANPGLSFDRRAAWGRRLNLPAGTAVRFEPGIDREVELVPFAGRRVIRGLRGDAAGALDAEGS